jgi:hypothetical protein
MASKFKFHTLNNLLVAGDEVAATDTVAACTPVAAITAADETHALNATFSDTEAEAALNALGVAVNEIIAALVAFGIAEAE